MIRAEFGHRALRGLQLHQDSDGSTTIWTPNGSRFQAAELSKTRRLLIARGYDVATVAGRPMFLCPYPFYLVVSGHANRRKS